MAGFALVLIGFVYDMLFAGIPYQDPTPEMQSRWVFHQSVADVFYVTGAVILLLGLLAAPVIWIVAGKRLRRLNTPDSR